MIDTSFYYFTNHRNLLQALAKGYLCNIDYWDRKTDDFSVSIPFTENRCLCFSRNQLDLPYTYKSDKTLSPVAFGLSKSKLTELGFISVEISNDEIVFIGDEFIPIDLIEHVIFKSPDDLRSIQQRYGEYLDLIDHNKYVVSVEEFEKLIPIPEKFTCKWPSKKYSSEKESIISKRIGSIGNYFIYLCEQDEINYLLFSDIIFYFLNNSTKDDLFEKSINEVKTIIPEWSINKDETLLIATLFISTIHKGIKTQIKHIKEFTKKLKVKFSDFDFDILLTFINSIDTVLLSLNEEIKIIDRVDLLLRIKQQLQKDFDKRSLNGDQIFYVIDKIKEVFDYSADKVDVFHEIDKLKCSVLRHFISGFELYIREPVDLDKINKAADLETSFPSPLCKAVPAFIWGRARGSFAFVPVKKKRMLESVYSKTFYTMVFNTKEMKEYHYYLLPESKMVDVSDNETITFGEYEIIVKSVGPTDQLTYEEYEYDIFTKSGLSLKTRRKDEYLDVLAIIDDILNNKKALNDKDIEFFEMKYLDSKINISVGLGNFKIEKKVTIDKDINLNYTGDLKFTISIPKMEFIKRVKKVIGNEYSSERFERLSIKEKRELRRHFSSANIKILSRKNIDPKSKKTQLDEIPDDSSTVKEIKQYLTEQNIPIPSTAKKGELLKLVNNPQIAIFNDK